MDGWAGELVGWSLAAISIHLELHAITHFHKLQYAITAAPQQPAVCYSTTTRHHAKYTFVVTVRRSDNALFVQALWHWRAKERSVRAGNDPEVIHDPQLVLFH